MHAQKIDPTEYSDITRNRKKIGVVLWNNDEGLYRIMLVHFVNADG